MRYFVKRGMKGSFPGSPDWDCCEVTEEQYDTITLMLTEWKDICNE